MKYLSLLLISISCLASEPLFHFKDYVKVVRGFYTGCYGQVMDYSGHGTYGVGIDNCHGEDLYEIFFEEDLKLSRKAHESL